MLRAFPILAFSGILAVSVRAEPLPPALADAGIEERLGNVVDGSLSFRDESGKNVTLNDYLSRGRPLLLNFAYFHCPMLCGLVQEGMVKGLKSMGWVPGREYEILTVSMDSREGPQEALPVKQHLLKSLGKPGAEAGWHVLTGDRKQVD